MASGTITTQSLGYLHELAGCSGSCASTAMIQAELRPWSNLTGTTSAPLAHDVSSPALKTSKQVHSGGLTEHEKNTPATTNLAAPSHPSFTFASGRFSKHQAPINCADMLRRKNHPARREAPPHANFRPACLVLAYYRSLRPESAHTVAIASADVMARGSWLWRCRTRHARHARHTTTP
jgi:hypothetical protein